MPPDFKYWMRKRELSPLRVVMGGGPRGSWFAWMLHGDFVMGPNVPQGMRQAAEDDTRPCNIRVAAIGSNDSWLLIWEDGVVQKVLGSEYEDLERKLGGLRGREISVRREPWQLLLATCLKPRL